MRKNQDQKQKDPQPQVIRSIKTTVTTMHAIGHPSYTLDHLCTFAVQLVGIAGMRLLLAVLETSTAMGFEHAMFRAEVSIAETAISHNALGWFLALLGTASRLAGGHDCRRYVVEGSPVTLRRETEARVVCM